MTGKSFSGVIKVLGSNYCPTLTSDPTLFNKAMELDIQIRIPTAPTAAVASLPIGLPMPCPVRLYAIWMNEVAIIGIAKLNNWLRGFLESDSLFLYSYKCLYYTLEYCFMRVFFEMPAKVVKLMFYTNLFFFMFFTLSDYIIKGIRHN